MWDLALSRRIFVAAVVLCGLLGCEADTQSQLISVHEVAPASLQVGDSVEVYGDGFPAGGRATVTLSGVVHRPLRAPRPVELDFPAVAHSDNQLEFALPASLGSELCGVPGEASHATFHGLIRVAFAPRVPGAPPVVGQRESLRLEVFPVAQSQEASARLEEELSRFAEFVGAQVRAEPEGVFVYQLEPGGRAEAAGLRVRDRVLAVDALTAKTAHDVLPQGTRTSDWLIEREAGAPLQVQVVVEGFRRDLPRQLELAAAVLVLFMAGLLVLGSRMGRLVALMRIARTTLVGSARAGAVSVQRLSVRWSVSDVLAGLGVLVLAWGVGGARLPGADQLLSVALALSALALVSSFVVGGRVGRGFRLRAGVRAVLWALLVELVFALGLLFAVADTGAWELSTLVAGQGGPLWRWYGFRAFAPFFMLSMMLVSLALLGAPAPAPGKHPLRELREARRLTKAVLVWGRSALLVALYLGGWQPLALGVLGLGLFAVKCLGVVWLVSLIRLALGTPRPESLGRAWFWMVPLCLVVVGSEVGGRELLLPAWLGWVVTQGTQLLWLLFLGMIVAVVAAFLFGKPPKRTTTVNPWI